MVLPISDKEYIAELEEERNAWKRDVLALRAEVEHLKANNRYQAGYAAGERAEREAREKAEAALRLVMARGHDDDCILCGFKDRVVAEYFALPAPARGPTTRLSTEDEARALMGDGQKLTHMREIS